MNMVMNKNVFIDRLTKIRELNSNRESFINDNIYKLLKRKEALLAGYEKIKSNLGSTTPANDTMSLDGFSQARLTKLMKQLEDESWQPRRARRVFISKANKAKSKIHKSKEKKEKNISSTELSLLGIQGPEEKIVQSTMSLLLEAIYEPVFRECSFGFRPRRGAHDALKKISNTFCGMTFAIEGDIKGMYDNVNHTILIKCLERRIKDPRFIQLVWKMLRAGYMIQGQKVDSTVGTPQGSIVSPILANIYLHELDNFMKDIEVKGEKPTRITTKQHKELLNRRTQLKKKIAKCDSNQEKKVLIKQLKRAKVESLSVRVSLNPPVRVVYVRYADDFIIGIAGKRSYTVQVKDQIKIFLKQYLNLEYNEEKSKITDLRKEKAFFLGHLIWIETKVKIARIHKLKHSPYLKRTTGHLIKVTAPLTQMVERLHMKGFCDRKGNPKSKVMWITQEDNQIIQLFNYTIRGIFNFYSGAQKRRSLARIWYILLLSCSHTLANKHRSSLKKIFTKHGKSLKVSYGATGEKNIQLFKPDLKESAVKWLIGKEVAEPYRYISFKMSKTKLFDLCCICGSGNAEMHHVRHLKDSPKTGKRDGFTRRIMGFINRKQIPVCRPCHVAIHAGKYDGISLKQFVNPELARR